MGNCQFCDTSFNDLGASRYIKSIDLELCCYCLDFTDLPYRAVIEKERAEVRENERQEKVRQEKERQEREKWEKIRQKEQEEKAERQKVLNKLFNKEIYKTTSNMEVYYKLQIKEFITKQINDAISDFHELIKTNERDMYKSSCKC